MIRQILKGRGLLVSKNRFQNVIKIARTRRDWRSGLASLGSSLFDLEIVVRYSGSFISNFGDFNTLEH